ncbi:MAG: YhbD family protein [Clostridiales bacterium]|nr:YhbD family protein [Clostridiales bacterium]
MFENEELISKKQLLRVARISYGTLYRWKRMNLIPESWFIHKATKTGQETFLPRDRVLARIERIQDLKGELTAEQLQEIFSPNVKSFLIPVDDFVKLNLVSKISMTVFTSVFPDKKNMKFDDVFGVYVIDHLMRLSGIYLEDAKQILRMLSKYLANQPSKEYQLLLLRKLGVPMTLLVKEDEDILLEDNTEVVACANLSDFEEALKGQLIA